MEASVASTCMEQSRIGLVVLGLRLARLGVEY